MADIHLFPVRASQENLGRIIAALTGAHAEGIDLGPRGFQIRVLSQSLEAAILDLRRMHDAFQTQSHAGMPGYEIVLKELWTLAAQVEHVVNTCRVFANEVDNDAA